MMTTLVSVKGASTFYGYVKDEENNPINGVSIVLSDCYFNILGYTSTNGAGYYSFSVTLNGNSPYMLSAGKTRYTYEYELVYSGGSNDFELDFIQEKIAVLFWASDAGVQTAIDDYIDILEYEGYTKFYEFKDISNVATSCQTVDNFERDQDTIFVYIIGHGNNSGGHSYTRFKSGGDLIRSDIFKGYMDSWEAERKCILVESCKSGDWADDFAASPYLAMSTSDEDHSSYTYEGHATPWEGKFSHWFFNHVYNGYNAVSSFYFASGYCTDPVQNPKIEDHSTYVWFN